MKFKNVPREFKQKIMEPRLMPMPEKIVVIHGSPGSGKTHETVDLINRMLKAGDASSAEFATMEGINGDIGKSISAKGCKEYIVERLQSVDVLLLDDLFTSEKHFQEPMFSTMREILVDRADNRRKTFITTNCDVSQIAGMDDGLRSRLVDDDRGLTRWHKLKKKKLSENGLGEEWTEDDPKWYTSALVVLQEVKGYHMDQDVTLITRCFHARQSLRLCSGEKQAMEFLHRNMSAEEMDILQESIDGEFNNKPQPKRNELFRVWQKDHAERMLAAAEEAEMVALKEG